MDHRFPSLERLRRQALTLVNALLWLQLPVLAGAAWLNDTSLPVALGAGLLLAVAGAIAARLDDFGERARIVSGVALMISISVLVATMAGGKTQVDMHMAYFVALAILASTCDWRAVAIAAVTVVLHHLVLNFAVPSLVYPGGQDIGRLAIHAVVVTMEAGALIWTARTIEAMFMAVALQTRQAEDARREAESLQTRAIEAATDARQVHEASDAHRAKVAEEDSATLGRLGDALSRLAAGELAFRLCEPLPPKAESLRGDFNDAMDKLDGAMRTVAATTGAIRRGTEEISAAAADLSQRTEHQAAHLQETATALDEITATVKRTADGATHARGVVSAAKADAEQSGVVVRQAVEAMVAIESSSRQVSNIIGVIDEIAFQTNLLALNAGVEAARAGDAGRGFAVVASEVRALAQRSAEAAKEIKALIQTSTNQVGQGVALVGDTGQALERIGAQIAQLNSVIAEIAASAAEQATGLQEVNAAVIRMDQVTHQNAAMVEQSTAASQSLAADAEELARLIGRFDVGKDAASLSADGMRRRPAVPTKANQLASVSAMKVTGRGGAVRRPRTAPDSWDAF